MRAILVAAVCTFLAAFVFVLQAPAQEPAPDLGETNSLNVACAFVGSLAEPTGVRLRNCRRYAPEESVGYRTRVTVRIVTDRGPFVIRVELLRSPWVTLNAYEVG